ncbi:MAG: GNAT family N-acetyltransferase [Bacteroidales bacterium]|nr:GNAT family N-acetyltransferase [Bacteroidales bacterium]
MNGILENGKIRLRAIEPEDLDLLFKWENNSSIWNVSNTLTPFSKHVLKQYLENSHLDIFQTKQFRFIIETIDGKAIGTIDLFDFDPFHSRAGIGILIADKSSRNKGFGSDALNLLIKYSEKVLQLNQLYCNITKDNTLSLKLFEKAGFEKNGLKKNWIKTSNGYIDEYFLQLML